MSHTRMTTLPFLLLALSPFVMSDLDQINLKSCLLEIQDGQGELL